MPNWKPKINLLKMRYLELNPKIIEIVVILVNHLVPMDIKKCRAITEKSLIKQLEAKRDIQALN